MKTPKLNPNALKWVKALESGKYSQTKDMLEETEKDGKPIGFCCLGVACDLYIKSGERLKRTLTTDGDTTKAAYGGNKDTLPTRVRRWLGLVTEIGDTDHGDALAVLNDDGSTFEQIATVIRSKPEGLFRKGK